MNDFDGKIIKFYGGADPQMFEIERRCMDRDGKVITYLNQHLPMGKVLDVGAGNGFTAEKLTNNGRLVIALEPDKKIIDPKKDIIWIKGVAQELPFHNGLFDAAYSTWAFFFPSMGVENVKKGLDELNRVVKKDGSILIIDNAGNDEFSSLADKETMDHKSDRKFWESMSFKSSLIETSFKFDTIEETRKLLGFYFGEKGKKFSKTEIQFNVFVYEGKSKG